VTRRRCIRFFFLMATMAALFSLSCRHKPAYNDVPPSETEKSRERARQQSPADTAAEPAPSPGSEDQQAPPPPSPPPPPPPAESTAASRSTEIKPPPFLDQNTGEFKDLPRYPRATRTYAQIGPINGIEAGLFMLETAASYERIAQFYDQAIKKNGWTVVSNTRDPEYYKWELKKGKGSEALIEVKPTGTSIRKNILLSRAERPPGK
jgi:hypothetical protein